MRGIGALGQGIGALGGDIGEAIQKHAEERRKQQEEQATNDVIMQHAQQQGRVTPEEMDKYQSSSWKQKNAIAHGHIFNMAQDMKEQMMAIRQEAQLHQIDAATARAELARARAQAVTAGPQTTTIPDPRTGQEIPVMRGAGGWQQLRTAKPATKKPVSTKAPKLSKQDQAALDWANQNPNDPRSAKIMEKLSLLGIMKNPPTEEEMQPTPEMTLQ